MKTRLPMITANVLGLTALLFPFVMSSGHDSSGYAARSTDAYWVLALLVPIIVGIAVSETARGKLDAKSVALLGVLSACAALLRMPVSFAGANLFFMIPLVGGYVFGSTFGFLLGTLGMATSALITGGIGPWLPFQMFAAGWVGGGAGCLQPLSKRNGRSGILALALYGWAAAFFYGAATSLSFWPLLTSADAAISWQAGIGLQETVRRYLAFYTLTSLGWDAVGAASNFVVLLLVGPGLVRVLQRFKRRFAYRVQPLRPKDEALITTS